jgi:hypothetical protein
MDRDTIIKLAREAGAFPELSETPEKDIVFLRRFAALVADVERRRLQAEAEDLLRAALAEPENDYERGFVDGMSNQAKSSVDRAVNAMARKPLTDDEIAQLMFKCDVIVTGPTQFNFARAIERAHGIGDEA